ncbi:MAG: hypothetical protein IT546_16765 [Caulobacteraceae bacterium]|nr:hypothetical protein [Caulobacteraceae bacterium]
MNRQERIAEEMVREHASDRDALDGAQAIQGDHHAVEVWDGARLVGRIGGEFSLPARF